MSWVEKNRKINSRWGVGGGGGWGVGTIIQDSRVAAHALTSNDTRLSGVRF